MEEDEDDEQEWQRWENEQDKQCEGGATLTGYKQDLVVLVLLLNWLLTTVVQW